ncbi:MAG TPA: hypothetical protein VGE04_02760 [Chloroflexia bacterium]
MGELERHRSPGLWAGRADIASIQAGGLHLYLVLLVVCAALCGTFLLVNRLAVPGLSAPGFPIDDGYIYSNYVREGANGLLFHYTPSEASGGITGLLWYFVLIPVRVVVNAMTAGELVRAVAPAYLLGVPLFALFAWLTYRLGRLMLRPLLNGRALFLAGLLPVLALFANPRMVWAAVSGLELPLSLVLVTASVYFFLLEADKHGAFAWTALAAGLLSWARPDLTVIAGVLAFVAAGGAVSRRWNWAGPLRVVVSIVAFAALLVLIYLVGYGRPLPSSFYAKSLALPVATGEAARVVVDAGFNPLRLVLRIAGNNFDSLLAVALSVAFIAVLGLALLQRKRIVAAEWRLGLLAVLVLAHFAAIAITIKGYSVQSRYVLPSWPLVAVLLAGAGILLARHRLFTRVRAAFDSRAFAWTTIGLVVALIAANTITWSLGTYVQDVRYSYDYDLQAGSWIRDKVPDDTPVAILNAGLVATVAAKHTAWVDTAGLVSPAITDHAGNTPYVWSYLREHNVRYSTVCWDEPWVVASPDTRNGCELDWSKYPR